MNESGYEADVLQQAYTPTEADVEQVAKMLRRHAESWVEDGETNSICPFGVALTKARPEAAAKYMVFAFADFNSAIEKRLAMRRMAEVCVEAQAIPFVAGLVTECWVASCPAQGPRPFVLPEDAENRREECLVHVASMTSVLRHEMAPITRQGNSETGAIRLGEWRTTEGTKFTSELLKRFYLEFYRSVCPEAFRG